MGVYYSIVSTFAGIIIRKKRLFAIFEINCGIFCIFVKKQGSTLFSSIGRVKIFSSKSRIFFVKKQPHPDCDSKMALCDLRISCEFRLPKFYVVKIPEKIKKGNKKTRKCFVSENTYVAKKIFATFATF